MEETKVFYDFETDISKFRVSERMQALLKMQSIDEFFPIQSATFDSIYDGIDTIINEITGSGKTLAYVIPLLERLRVQRKQSAAKKILIGVPTLVLAEQILEVVLLQQDYSREFRVEIIESRETALSEKVDIFIFSYLVNYACFTHKNLRNFGTVVMDEVDVESTHGFYYGDRSFEEINKLLRHSVQYVLVTSRLDPYRFGKYHSMLKQNSNTIDLVYLDPARANTNITHYVFNKETTTDIGCELFKFIIKYSEPEKTVLLTFRSYGRDNLEGLLEFFHRYSTYLNMKIIRSKILNREIRCQGVKVFLVMDSCLVHGLDLPDVDLVIQTEINNRQIFLDFAGRTGRGRKIGKSILCFDSQ